MCEQICYHNYVHIFHHVVKEQEKTDKSQEPYDSKHYTLKNLYHNPDPSK